MASAKFSSLLASAVLGIYFLPYLGSSTYRIDQFFGMAAVAWSATRYLFQRAHRKPCSAPVWRLWLHSVCILIFVMLRAALSGADLEDSARIILNFSYPAVGMSLFIVMNEDFGVGTEVFIRALLAISIPVNLIAVFMSIFPVSAKSQFLNLHYSGPVYSSYGDGLNEATLMLTTGRVSGLFAHPMALATFALLILAVALPFLAEASRTRDKVLSILSLGLSIAGGLATSSKTYIGTLLVMAVSMLLLNRARWNVRKSLAVKVAAMVALLFGYSYVFNPWTALWLRALLRADVGRFLASRFGAEGWILRSGTLHEAFRGSTLLAGDGVGALNWAWADCGLLEPILFGGIGFFLLFFSFPLRLARLCFRTSSEHRGNIWLVALLTGLMSCSLGVGVFLFPRSAALIFLTVPFLLFRSAGAGQDNSA